MDTRPSPQRSLSYYTDFLRRQRWVVVLFALAGVGLAVVALTVLPKTYSASASVLVEAPDTGSSEATDARTTGEVNMDTEARVVSSQPVAGVVREELGSVLTTSALIRQVSVSVPPNTTILSITFEADSASAAREGADAFASAYLDYRSTQAEQRITDRLEVLRTQAVEVENQIRELNAISAGLPEAAPRQASLDEQVRTLRTRAAGLDAQILPLLTAGTDSGSVIDSAVTPQAPSSPDTILVVGSTVVLMLLLGLLVAWWRDRHRGLVRSAGDVEGDFSVEVLGVVALDHDPTSSKHSYRQLVHAISARLGEGSGVVLVAGVGVGDGAAGGDVATVFAVAVARSGTDVLLVHSDVATARAGAGAAQAGGDRLSVTSLESQGLLVEGDMQQPKLRDYLAAAGAQESRLTVLAAPPSGASADAQAIAPHVDLTILVVELGRSTHAEVEQAMRQLRQVGTPGLGAVVVRGRDRSRRSAAAASAPVPWVAAPSTTGPSTTAPGTGASVASTPPRTSAAETPATAEEPVSPDSTGTTDTTDGSSAPTPTSSSTSSSSSSKRTRVRHRPSASSGTPAPEADRDAEHADGSAGGSAGEPEQPTAKNTSQSRPQTRSSSRSGTPAARSRHQQG